MFESDEISNKMFSLFIKPNSTNSTIQFGGFEKNGIKEGATLYQLESNKSGKWHFGMTEVKAGGVALNDEDKFAEFNPAFPWIYLSKPQFTVFAEQFEAEWLGSFKCDISKGVCKIEQSCEAAKQKDFSFTASVDGVKITVPTEEMLISGS
jgi:hypothetical protein